MKKKKLFLLSLFIFPLLLLSKVYFIDLYADSNTNSIAVLHDWKWLISSSWKLKMLSKNSDFIISSWDRIESIWSWSLVEIKWWDWSITRLWWNSKLLVNENFVSNNLNKINIDIELLKWRTWSNIKSILWSKSYFRESWWDTIAAIRWTVFSMDIDEDYIKVIDHKVNLFNKYEWSEDINAWEIYTISTVKQISLEDFMNNKIKSDLDKYWESINKKLDEKYLEDLLLNIKSKSVSSNPILSLMEVFSPKYRAIYEIDNSDDLTKLSELIDNLSDTDREYVKNYLLYRYQDINFVKSWDDLFEKKIAYKDLLTELSWDNDKRILVNSTIYDLQDSIKNNNKNALESISNYINNNDKLIKQDELKDILIAAWWSKYIDEDLKKVLFNNFEWLKDLVNVKDVNLDNISSSVKEWLNWAKEWLNKFLDDKVWESLNNFLNK